VSRQAGQLNTVARKVVGPLFRVLWRFEVDGLDRVPGRGPAILTPNHTSVIDSFFLPCVLPRRITYVGKAEYLDDWKTRYLFPALGMIPIDRTGGDAAEAALSAAESVLRRGELFGIYPEGTRSRNGKLHKGHTGPARLALRTGAPIVPVGLIGTREIQPPDTALPTPFRPVTVRFGHDITITLPDGSARSLPEGSTGTDLAASIGSRLAKAAVIVNVDGIERDLRDPLPDGATVAVITAEHERGLYTMRHSTAHVLAQAVLDLFPGATFAIGPPSRTASTTTSSCPTAPRSPRTTSSASTPACARSSPPISPSCARVPVPRACSCWPTTSTSARSSWLCRRSADAVGDRVTGTISFYRNPPRFVDLCRGPHVPSTGTLPRALQADAGGRRVLARRREEPDAAAHLRHGVGPRRSSPPPAPLEEAAKRDHRKLATELDLLSASPRELGGGLAVWHPKGAIVRKLMEDYSAPATPGRLRLRLHAALANGQLFETSGHLDFYADGMYPPMEMDNGAYYPKPMNCPMHCLIFRSGSAPTASCRCAVRAGHGVPLRAGGHAARAHAHPRLHPGRQPHLLHRGPGCRARSPRC
jgi:1-acyl-sn-glycerol-3-phosphate acyltransferase